MKNFWMVLVVMMVVMIAGWTVAGAQACDFTIDGSVQVVDGYQSPYTKIGPGSIVCVLAGARSGLVIQNIRGSAENYVKVVNTGGRVELTEAVLGNGIELANSEYVYVLGDGDPSYKYGFKIIGSNNVGFRIWSKTRNVRVERVEIAGATHQGLAAKTDYAVKWDTNENGTLRDEWEQWNTVIVGNYIHDVDAEGMYVGSSYYLDGADPVLRGVEIVGNVVERTGWDGIQVGSAVSGVRVSDNDVRDSGLSDAQTSGNGRYGIIVNAGSTGEWYGNMVTNSRGTGMFVQGLDGNQIFNNIISNSGLAKVGHGINVTSGLGTRIYNNTLAAGTGVGIRMIGGSGVVANNIISGFAQGGEVNTVGASFTNNLVAQQNSLIGYRSELHNDFHLLDWSSGVDSAKGVDVPGLDFQGIERPVGVDYDRGAYEYVSGMQMRLEQLKQYGMSKGLDLNYDEKINSWDWIEGY